MGSDLFFAAVIPIVCGVLVSYIVTRFHEHKLRQKRAGRAHRHDDSDL